MSSIVAGVLTAPAPTELQSEEVALAIVPAKAALELPESEPKAPAPLTLEKDGIEIVTEIAADDPENEPDPADLTDHSLSQGTTEDDSSEDDDPTIAERQQLRKTLQEAGLDPDSAKVTYVFEVTDEGAIVVNNGTGKVPKDAPAHVYFPVSLPITQIKSLTNPIPGAIKLPPGLTGLGSTPGQTGAPRSRKSKLEVRKFDDEYDDVGPTSRSSGQTQNSTMAEQGYDPLGLNSTDFETALSSPQAQQILANLNNPTPSPKTTFTINVQQGPSGPKKQPAVSVSVVPPKAAAPPPVKPKSDPAPTTSSSTAAAAESKRIADETAARNSRRSLRQQDRHQREEAERIMAENQQMLQKEKEMLKAKSSPVGGTTPKISNTAPAPAVAKDTGPTPKKVPASAPPGSSVKKSSTPGTPKPLTNTPKTQAAAPGPKIVNSTPAPGSVDRPRRANRKLPAHLADPNYIDPDATKPLGGSSGGNEIELVDLEADTEEVGDEDSGEKVAGAEGDDQDYQPETEEEEDIDDPNKLWCICRRPHNNRFMICCDRCNDWFHGKCVGITKAQGDAMEKQNKTWNCPSCRKILKAESQKGVAVVSSKKPNPQSQAIKTNATPKTNEKDSEAPRTSSGNRRSSVSTSKRAKSPDITSPPPKRTSSSPDKKEKLRCVVCKHKEARSGSIYCGDSCVIKHSKVASKTPSNNANPAASSEVESCRTSGPTTPTSPTKLKRLNSKSLSISDPSSTETKPPENFLTFHVISSSSKQSTEVVPPAPTVKKIGGVTPVKELTASQLLKQQKAATVAASSETTTSPKKIQIIEPQPQVQGARKSSISSTLTKKSSSSESSGSTKKDKEAASSSTHAKKESHSQHHNSKSSDSSSSSNSRKRKSSESHGKSSVSAESKKPPIPPRKDIDNDPECRAKVTENLCLLFKQRMKELNETDRSSIPSSVTPDEISDEIEQELFKLYDSTTNQKYRNKSRALYFNLKDIKNPLYRNILQLKISPFDLVRMESHQFANPELIEWRNRESRKELDLIKRNEIEKIAEAKKLELLESGVEIEKLDKVEEETRQSVEVGESEGVGECSNSSSGISESTSHGHTHSTRSRQHSSSSKSKSHHHSSQKSSSSSSRHHGRSSRHHHHSSSSDKKESHQKDRKSSTTSSSSHHRSVSTSNAPSGDKTSRSSSRTSNQSTTDRDRKSSTTKVKHSSGGSGSGSSSETKSKVHQGKSLVEQKKESGSLSPTLVPPGVGSGTSKTSQLSFDENSNTSIFSQHSSSSGGAGTPGGQHSVGDKDDSSPVELPSSTIKTPDFSEESGSGGGGSGSPSVSGSNSSFSSEPFHSTEFVMPEVGQFKASLFHCSHFPNPGSSTTGPGIYFPKGTIPIVGRIGPSTVWDYIDKMRKSKEVLVYRLAPSSPSEADGYQALFKYFSSRGKLAVCGGVGAPFKDVYLFPLEKNCPVNGVLLPFRGPGLPKERSHCFLAIVTKNIDLKRRSSSISLQGSYSNSKRMKLTGDIKPGLISLTLGQKPSPPVSIAAPLPDVDEKSKETVPPAPPPDGNEDDDAPYEPWEEEDLDGNESVPAKPPQDLLKELEAQIAREKQEIECISVAIQMNQVRGADSIPGLDGEFGDDVPAPAPSAPVSTLSALPPKLKKSLPLPPIPGVIDIESDEDEEAPYSPSAMEY